RCIENDSESYDILVKVALNSQALFDAFRCLGEDSEGEGSRLHFPKDFADFNITGSLRFNTSPDHHQIHITVISGFAVSMASEKDNPFRVDAFNHDTQVRLKLICNPVHGVSRVVQ